MNLKDTMQQLSELQNAVSELREVHTTLGTLLDKIEGRKPKAGTPKGTGVGKELLQKLVSEVRQENPTARGEQLEKAVEAKADALGKSKAGIPARLRKLLGSQS